MKKNMYRAKKVKDITVEKLSEHVQDQRVVFGIDVAKEDMYAVFMNEKGAIIVTVTWKHPSESELLLALLRALPCSRLEAVMEPSGTYGDSIRFQLHQVGIPVFRVSAKKSHDYGEIYDGVPSSHDAKSAAIIAALHLAGKSEAWSEQSVGEKELRAALRLLELHESQYYRLINQLEALLARHWPELTNYLDLTTVSLVALLGAYGSAQAVAAASQQARKLLIRTSRGGLDQSTIACVLESATKTLGIPPIAPECVMIRHIAREAHRAYAKAQKAKQHVERLSQESESVRALSRTVGKVSAAVLYAYLGNPSDYSCAAAYAKAFGLNLKERSSGKHKGQLKLTKRGPSLPRLYIFFAVLRKIKDDKYFKNWYERKIKRDGGRKGWALVALMRKLAKALWYVGQGHPFESHLLFESKRLKISEPNVLSD